MRRSLHLFIGILLATASGCSLLFPSDRYVGDGPDDGGDQTIDAGAQDGGSMDAGTIDAGPNAPTTPEIELTPTEPFTDDDLTVQITTESTDPLGSTITYEYQWLRGTEVALEGETTVPASETTKHEEWTVLVTPVADGNRRGVPARTTVGIQNSPPIVTTVALRQYRPIEGETLFADPGAVTDADGDSPVLEYTWYRDGSPVPSIHTSAYPIAEVPGTELVVELLATDGDSASDPVSAGPAIVLSDETRWRQLLPNRAMVEGVALDRRNERLLLTTPPVYGAASLWEYDLRHDRFSQLHPEGSLESEVPIAFSAPEGNAIWFLGRSRDDKYTVTKLDTSRRGSESFTLLELTGDTAALTAGFPTGILDPELNRIVTIVGSTDDASICSIDLATGNVTIEAAGLVTRALGGTWILPPNSRSVLILGGITAFTDPIVVHDAIHRLDLDNLAAGFNELSATLHTPQAFPGAVVDVVNDRIVYGGGFGGNFSPIEGLGTVGYDGIGAAAYTPAGDVSNRAGWGALMARDPVSDRLLIVPGRPGLFDRRAFEVYGVDTASDEVVPVHVYGVTAPAPVRSAMVTIIDGEVFLFGGQDLFDQARGEMWRMPFGHGTVFSGWSSVVGSAASPGPRYGQFVDSGLERLAFFGGRGVGGSSAETAMTWVFDGSSWTQYTDPDAPAAIYAAYFSEGCGSDTLLYMRRVTDERIGEATCAGTTCDWMPITSTGVAPGRYWAPVWQDHSTLGYLAADGSTSLYSTCSHEWSPITATGTLPDARFGFTSVERGGGQTVLFGGRSGTDAYLNSLYNVHLDSGSLLFEEIALAGDSPEPGARAGHVAVWDPYSSRMLVYGGTPGGGFLLTTTPTFGDLWELRIRP